MNKMKMVLVTVIVLFLAVTETLGARNWLSKAAYNKWHETELERWLSDHDIPHPTAAHRKDLEDLVKVHWESHIQIPPAQPREQVLDSLNSVKDWIFDSWSDSQLKTFLDEHGITTPQPKQRDSLLASARENYEAIAQKLSQTSLYPGNWLYDQWSESDLKEYLDSRGYRVPQPTTRDKLIASVRRNARLASLELQRSSASASSSAASAQSSLTEALFGAWSEADFKEFFDKHHIKVPQGSTRNEFIALARKHRASLLEDPVTSGTDALGAATSKAGNELARATEDARMKVDDLFNSAIQTWSDSRLKAFLDARGVPVPQGGTRDELLANVRYYRHKAATERMFDTWERKDLEKFLMSQHQKAQENAGLARDQLVKDAQSVYDKASKAGCSQYASATSYLASATGVAKDINFKTWSRADVESYLDSYGFKGHHGSDIEQLCADARRHTNYFLYGTTQQEATLLSRLQSGIQWFLGQLKTGALSGRADGRRPADAAKEKGSKAAKRIDDEL